MPEMSKRGEVRKCYICGTTIGIECHHVFGGAYRNKSTKYGYVRDLCAAHHRTSKYSAHLNMGLNHKLRRECQREFEQTRTREEFIKEFGRSYL